MEGDVNVLALESISMPNTLLPSQHRALSDMFNALIPRFVDLVSQNIQLQ